jgi:hypothetical protein
MTPPKRRTRPGEPVHHGRTTDRRATPQPLPHPASDPFAVRRRATSQQTPSSSEVEATKRTAPRKPVVRIRPTWHRWVGAGLLACGISLLIVNDVMMLQPELPRLLPGGHNELYLLAAVMIAGYSTWFFGWFDRPT